MKSSIHTNTGPYVGHRHLKYGSKLHNILVLVSSGKACKRCIEQKEVLIYLCSMYKERPLVYIEERKQGSTLVSKRERETRNRIPK
jgi:hypothetical protein